MVWYLEWVMVLDRSLGYSPACMVEDRLDIKNPRTYHVYGVWFLPRAYVSVRVSSKPPLEWFGWWGWELGEDIEEVSADGGGGGGVVVVIW